MRLASSALGCFLRAGYGCVAWVLVATTCPGAEQQFRPSLERYLKGIGYEPIRLKRGLHNDLVVWGELHGKERSFLVDTGCSVSVLDRGTARRLKTLGELGLQLDDSFLGKVIEPSFVLMDLKLGRAAFTNQPARTRSLDIAGHSNENALLGCDFLFRNFCLVDCLDSRLYVRAEDLPREAAKGLEGLLLRSGFHAVKLSPHSSLVLTCEATVEHQHLRLVVDTGATYSVLDKNRVKRLRLSPELTSGKIAGIGRVGEHWLDVVKLKSLQLGDLSLANVRFGLSELDSWGIGEPGRVLADIDGLLGGEQLLLNQALIDCRHLKLWLQPGQTSQ